MQQRCLVISLSTWPQSSNRMRDVRVHLLAAVVTHHGVESYEDAHQWRFCRGWYLSRLKGDGIRCGSSEGVAERPTGRIPRPIKGYCNLKYHSSTSEGLKAQEACNVRQEGNVVIAFLMHG